MRAATGASASPRSTSSSPSATLGFVVFAMRQPVDLVQRRLLRALARPRRASGGRRRGPPRSATRLRGSTLDDADARRRDAGRATHAGPRAGHVLALSPVRFGGGPAAADRAGCGGTTAFRRRRPARGRWLLQLDVDRGRAAPTSPSGDLGGPMTAFAGRAACSALVGSVHCAAMCGPLVVWCADGTRRHAQAGIAAGAGACDCITAAGWAVSRCSARPPARAGDRHEVSRARLRPAIAAGLALIVAGCVVAGAAAAEPARGGVDDWPARSTRARRAGCGGTGSRPARAWAR